MMQEQAFVLADEVQIRAATISDIGNIIQVQATAPEAAQWADAIYIDIFTVSEIPPLLLERKILCAVHAKAIIGFAVISKLRVGETTECELENLAILPRCRRAGIGCRLIQAVQDACRECGGDRVSAEVRRSNAAAIKLYENKGFLLVGCRKKYYNHPEEDAVLLEWVVRQNQMAGDS